MTIRLRTDSPSASARIGVPTSPAVRNQSIPDGARTVVDGLAPAAPVSVPAASSPPVPPALPAWYPAGFDLDKGAQGVKDLMIAQGESPDSIGPGKASKLLFSDGDGTIFETKTPVYLKDTATGAQVVDPKTGELLAVPGVTAVDYVRDLAKLKTDYPNLPWDRIKPDWSDYDSIAEVLRTPDAPQMLNWFERSSDEPSSRTFLVTARTGAPVAPAVHEYFRERGVHLNGALVVSEPGQMQKLGLTNTLTSAQRKAVAMAEVIQLYDPSQVKSVRFFDDGDDNLVASMQLLPALFPNIRFEFWDSISTGGYHFTPKRIAVSLGNGQLVGSDGQSMSPEQIASYTSIEDVPLPPIDVATLSQP